MESITKNNYLTKLSWSMTCMLNTSTHNKENVPPLGPSAMNCMQTLLSPAANKQGLHKAGEWRAEAVTSTVLHIRPAVKEHKQEGQIGSIHSMLLTSKHILQRTQMKGQNTPFPLFLCQTSTYLRIKKFWVTRKSHDQPNRQIFQQGWRIWASLSWFGCLHISCVVARIKKPHHRQSTDSSTSHHCAA